jgi:imidazolonepropionase-like amidohydrolase
MRPSIFAANSMSVVAIPVNIKKHRIKFLKIAAAVLASGVAHAATAQVSSERIEGLRDNTPRWHAITNARIIAAPGKVIERGTLVLRDGRIVSVGADVPIPAGARVWKMDGRTVYAGFIDLNSNVGVPAAMRPAPPSLPPWQQMPGMAPAPEPRQLAARSLATANRFVRADAEVATQLELRAEDVKATRELGFTSVLASPGVGVFRGQSVLLNLADSTDAKTLVMQPRAAQHIASEYERSFSGRTYPGSQMGAIALVRQTLYNARWYEKSAGISTAERLETSATLSALQPVISARQPVIYVAESEQDFQRIAKIRDEFQLRTIIGGNGYEYRLAAQLKTLGMPVIAPVNFPVPPDVENPDSALDVSLEQLQHWEQAPSNLAQLQKAGVTFAITAHGLREAKDFWPNVRQAVRRGLSADAALAALTTAPARMIGMERSLGTLEVGQLANVVIASGDMFASDNAEIELAFVDGRPYQTPAYERFDPRGAWTISVDGKQTTWNITGTRAKPTLTIDSAVCEIAVRNRQLIVTLPCGKNLPPMTVKQIIVAERVGEDLRGSVQTGENLSPWSAKRAGAFTETPDANSPAALARSLDVGVPAPPATYPAGAFGVTPAARATHVLIRNATVWTSARAGRLTQTDVLVRDGKIAAIGKALAAPADATIVDATGKHLTPGMIDAHSHTAIIGGVNEPTSSVTAEVRVGDVVDATDINIYRQLAGGVTAANLLHGSANTIGGQAQVVKFRWGMDAEGLKVADATPGIKFALGENVKQSNWNLPQNVAARYPQTRMGVEQILRDSFQAARHYQKQWAAWRANPKGLAEPSRDLQLDTLVEILEKKRVIHIHSYRADEILMFVRIAQEFGFTVAAFQHVLEGYKVADAIASIGAGGSTFSDWWAYKMEVYDAIPTNGAIMHRAGVVTTFNSDSNELARRLNTEAAKAVRYGGLEETEALKFVTINAAKQLRIDNRTGSIEAGKDADFVIWNDSPLSTNAVAEQTWIEGKRYYDRATDKALRDDADKERARILAKAIPARMARLNAAPPGGARPGGAGGGVSDPSAAPPSTVMQSVRDVMQYIAMQNWLHQANQFRDSYWNGGNWHECKEDAR